MVADLRASQGMSGRDEGAPQHVAGSRLDGARRVVLKVGSALLVDAARGLDEAWLAGLAADIAAFRAQGADVIVVSSGAIALGRRVLGFDPGGAIALEQAQAAAAVGQIALARAYSEALGRHGLTTGQVLLTLGDTQDRRRYLNGRATLKTLLHAGVVPIVNENDTVATDEIRYGDNDRLAARVALMAGADALFLLSDVDGLYTGDPRRDPNARRLDLVTEITPEIEAMGAGPASGLSRGGMITKIQAARTAMQGGCALVIARGAPEPPLERVRPVGALRAGGPCTWFLPVSTPQAARKQWILGMKPMGALIVDEGAARALTRGKSLLPAGIREVHGAFERGDPVEIQTQAGVALGAALSGYSSEEASLLVGRHTTEIAEILGYEGRAAAAHRDDMALWEDGQREDRLNAQ